MKANGVETSVLSKESINGAGVSTPSKMQDKSGAVTSVAEKSTTEVVPPGYKQTKVGVIPEDWDTPRIDSVLQRIRKKVDVEKETMYQQIGIRSHAKGIFHKESVSGEALGNKSVFWIEEDCFIVNIVFAWEQAVAKTTDAEKGMIASHRFPMYQPKDNKSDIDYILYFFKSKRGKHLLGLASPGGAGRNKTLGQGEFSELKIPLPPLKEQQKIAQILSTWDDAISKQENLIKAKETLKKGLMQKLLSGEVRFDGEWEEVRLGNIGKIIRGVSYKPNNLSLSDNSETIRLMRSNNIQLGYLDIQKKLQYVDKSKVKESQKLQLGDLAICMANGSKNLVGKNGDYTIVDDYSYTVGAFCAIFRFKENSVNSFFRYLFQTDKYNYYVQNLLAGSNINNLKGSDIESMKFIIPNNKQEQQKIAQVLTLSDKEIELLKEELETLKEQKRGLMQRLLSGEVRTNNIKENE